VALTPIFPARRLASVATQRRRSETALQRSRRKLSSWSNSTLSSKQSATPTATFLSAWRRSFLSCTQTREWKPEGGTMTIDLQRGRFLRVVDGAGNAPATLQPQAFLRRLSMTHSKEPI
jgi:hypothetical protein